MAKRSMQMISVDIVGGRLKGRVFSEEKWRWWLIRKVLAGYHCYCLITKYFLSFALT